MHKERDHMRNKWSVFRENSTISFICVFIIIFNIVFIGLSSLLISFLPENKGRGFFEVVKLAFTLMVNPSGKYTYTETTVSQIITTVVVLLGMISLTGGTVGIITSFIQSLIQRSATSRSHLRMKDHIVVLNYNNRVPSMIVDYCYDDEKSTYVVILSQNDKAQIIDEINCAYKSLGIEKKFKNVIVRTGNPMSQVELDKVNIAKAKTVLIMTPRNVDGASTAEDRGFLVSTLFMFLTMYFAKIKKDNNTNIVIETSSSNMEAMVHNYDNAHANQISASVKYNEIIGQLIAITSIMPSIYSVMQQLFSFEGVELYLKDVSGDVRFEDALMKNKSSIPLYEIDKKRVYLAEDEDKVSDHSGLGLIKKELPKHIINPTISFNKEEILIIGTNEKLKHILNSLIGFKKKYSHNMHVILAATQAEEPILQHYYKREKYACILEPDKRNYVIIEDIYNPTAELDEAILKNADSIIFLSDENVSDIRIDEKPLIYWTNLRNAFRKNKRVDVIVEILNSKNKEIIEIENRDQTLVSDDFLGHLYAQLGKNPKRLDVLIDMITAKSGNKKNTKSDKGDFLCMDIDTLFGDTSEELRFLSKRDLILWIYHATGGVVLPFGVIKEGVPYIFSHVTNDRNGLDSTVLLSIDNREYQSDLDYIELRKEDELVFFLQTDRFSS